MSPIFSVSVDLDGLGCYAAIHGQDPRALDRRALEAVPVVALSRLCALFADLGVPATFFAIGRELVEIDGAAAALGSAARAGHEIASHSHDHDYALSRRTPQEIADDLRRADEAIQRACGRAPRGFRAPGYTLSRALIEAVKARGHLYDSSLLPSPGYYAAKAAAIGLHAARGRSSQSILGGPVQLFWRRGPQFLRGLRELPIATLPLLRLPIIGTLAVAAPAAIAAGLLWAARAGGHVNLELHGIDVLDATDGAPAALAQVQPGLTLPAGKKLERLRSLIEALRRKAEPMTLERAATAVLPAAD